MRLAKAIATAGLVTACASLDACVGMGDEPLPPAPRAALFREPSGCVPLPAPPTEPPDSAPLDPRRCLGGTWAGKGLPVDVKIVDGRVTSIAFYDQCSGDIFDVPDAVRSCIEKSLATWRYPIWPTCPGEHSRACDVLYLEPVGGAMHVAGDVRHGCAG
jgi:hypothetical protein